MSRHTPGPWDAAWDGEFFVACDTGAKVAVAVPGTHDAGRSVSPSEAEANAMLMAAAPELLDALEAIRKAYSFETGLDWLDAVWPMVDRALDKAYLGEYMKNRGGGRVA